jgi:hypothetical protein
LKQNVDNDDDDHGSADDEFQHATHHYMESLRRHSRFLFETLRNVGEKDEDEDSAVIDENDHSDILNLSFLILTKQHRFVSYPKLYFRQKNIEVQSQS